MSHTRCLIVGMSIATAAFAAHSAPTLINDTAATVCYAPTGNNPPTVACAGSGQDGEYGRDVTANNPNNGDHGFRLAKVCNNGHEAGASGCPLAPPLGLLPSEWGCTLDKVSGLLWEVKTTDGTDRDMAKVFGYTDYPLLGLTGADTFAAAVNAAPGGLCGATDWRVPTYLELGTLLDYARILPAPRIDPAFFPNTPVDTFGTWTTTPYTFDGTYHRTTSFGGGGGDGSAGFWPQHARLVRGTPLDTVVRFAAIANGTGVKDSLTRIVWRICAEGAQWNGSACIGTPLVTTWAGALALAAAAGSPWRLPSIAELATLLLPDADFGCTLLPEPFPVIAPLWTNTPEKAGNRAAVFDHGFGTCRPRTSQRVNAAGEVRLVRDY